MSAENEPKSCVDCARTAELLHFGRDFAEPRTIRAGHAGRVNRQVLKNCPVWCFHDGKTTTKVWDLPWFRCSASSPQGFSSRYELTNSWFKRMFGVSMMPFMQAFRWNTTYLWNAQPNIHDKSNIYSTASDMWMYSEVFVVSKRIYGGFIILLR